MIEPDFFVPDPILKKDVLFHDERNYHAYESILNKDIVTVNVRNETNEWWAQWARYFIKIHSYWTCSLNDSSDVFERIKSQEASNGIIRRFLFVEIPIGAHIIGTSHIDDIVKSFHEKKTSIDHLVFIRYHV